MGWSFVRIEALPQVRWGTMALRAMSVCGDTDEASQINRSESLQML